MDQVSPEVKEAYLNNLTYTTINKKDWKALNGKYNIDNARDKQNIFEKTMPIITIILIIIVSAFAIFFDNEIIMIFALFSFIPVIIMFVENKFDIVYNMIKKRDRFLYNYRKANDTFNVLIEGNDKYRYYSRWYLQLINPKVEVYESRLLGIGSDEGKKYVRFNDVRKIVDYEHPVYGHQRFQYQIHPVTRHPDRFNWRNTLSTNRVLSVEEYKNLIKSKEEFKKYMEMEEDIREFQEYNGL